MKLADLSTPALLIDADVLDHNLATMAAALPGSRLRPHVKAHKCTALARLSAPTGTAVHLRDATRGGRHGRRRARRRPAAGQRGRSTRSAWRAWPRCRIGRVITVAVDSDETIDAAAAAGIGEVLIDVNVGLPRCGCKPSDAGHLADYARSRGLEVRGVMGYEGHLMVVPRSNRAARQGRGVDGEAARRQHARRRRHHLRRRHRHLRPARPGRPRSRPAATRSMDTHYGRLGLPFRQACFVLATVISVEQRVGGGRRRPEGARDGPRQPVDRGRDVWFCSDEHITFAPAVGRSAVGDRVQADPGPHRPDDGDARSGMARARRRGDRPLADRPAGLVSSTSSVAAGGQQRAEGAAAMRQRVLLGVGHLGERAPVALVGHEHRVVAEAAIAALGGRDRALDRRPRRAARARRASPPSPTVTNCAVRSARVTQLAQQLSAVVGVRRVLAGEARRVHARRAAERVDVQAGVVGDGRQAGGVADRRRP